MNKESKIEESIDKNESEFINEPNIVQYEEDARKIIIDDIDLSEEKDVEENSITVPSDSKTDTDSGVESINKKTD